MEERDWSIEKQAKIARLKEAGVLHQLIGTVLLEHRQDLNSLGYYSRKLKELQRKFRETQNIQ